MQVSKTVSPGLRGGLPCARALTPTLSDSVLRERTGALLLRPALHKSPLYVDKVSATLRPPLASSSLAAPSAMFTRPPGGSPEQSGSLLITLDYFHSPGVSQAFRQGAGEGWFLDKIPRPVEARGLFAERAAGARVVAPR